MTTGVPLEPADETFIKTAPALIQVSTNREAPHDTLWFAARLKSDGTAAEKAEAKTVADAMLADGWKAPALSLMAYLALVNDDMTGAQAQATKAIEADEFLAWQNRAYLTRLAVYEKLGKTDEKIADEKILALYGTIFKTLSQ